MDEQAPPRQQLIQDLPRLFSGKGEAWIGNAASVLSRTAADAIAGILVMDDPVKRSFVEAELETAGNTAAGLATVHVKKNGKDLPAYDVPVIRGTVNLKQVQQDESVIIEAVAVSDTADQTPDYQPLKHLSVPARAGQHVFVKAQSTDKTGGSIAVRIIISTAIQLHSRMPWILKGSHCRWVCYQLQQRQSYSHAAMQHPENSSCHIYCKEVLVAMHAGLAVPGAHQQPQRDGSSTAAGGGSMVALAIGGQ